MKEGANGRNLGSIMIPTVRRVQKSLFRVSTPNETEDMSVSLTRDGRVVH